MFGEKRKEEGLVHLDRLYYLFFGGDWLQKLRNFYILYRYVYWSQRKSCENGFEEIYTTRKKKKENVTFLWGQDFSIMLGNEIRTRRNDYTIFALLTCSSNRTSLNLEHSPVFFEHPVYTRSPSLRKCGSFDWEIISLSSWRGTGTRDLEWRRSRVFERGIISPLVSHPPPDQLNIFHSERTLVIIARKATRSPPPSWKLSWCIIDIRVIGTIPFSRQTVERLLCRAV